MASLNEIVEFTGINLRQVVTLDQKAHHSEECVKLVKICQKCIFYTDIIALLIFKLHTSMECGVSVTGASLNLLNLSFRVSHPILIGCHKSCDIRIIDYIIVRCQQGQMIQQVTSVKVSWLRPRSPKCALKIIPD